jgi:hypothetical protein
MSDIDTIPHQVTVFRNIKSTDTPFYRDVRVMLDRIKDGQSKDLIKKIRSEKNKAERQELKKALPSICFSGTFIKRSDASIEEHSGLVCLDFDGYPKKKDMLEAKEKLTKSQYTYSVFISPSGDGLKVLVRIPADPETHKQYFNEKSEYRALQNVRRLSEQYQSNRLFIAADNHRSYLHWHALLHAQGYEVKGNNPEYDQASLRQTGHFDMMVDFFGLAACRRINRVSPSEFSRFAAWVGGQRMGYRQLT